MEGRTGRHRLAENLRIQRLLRHWSQEALAAAAGLDRSYLGAIERAERNVSLDTLERLAAALGLPVEALLAEPDPARLGQQLLALVREAVVSGRHSRVRETPATYRGKKPLLQQPPPPPSEARRSGVLPRLAA